MFQNLLAAVPACVLVEAVMPTFLLMVQCCHLTSVIWTVSIPTATKEPSPLPACPAVSPVLQRTDANELLSNAALPLTRALDKTNCSLSPPEECSCPMDSWSCRVHTFLNAHFFELFGPFFHSLLLKSRYLCCI